MLSTLSGQLYISALLLPSLDQAVMPPPLTTPASSSLSAPTKFLATFVPLAYPRWIVCAVSVMWVSWISSDYDNHIYLMLSDFLTMPKLSTCFVCASLKTGTIVIGLLQLDASIILIIASIVAMAAPSVNMVVIC